MKTLQFEVLTPVQTVLNETDVLKVRLKLADGRWLSIYPRHAPLLAATLEGEMSYVTSSGEQKRDLPSGILYVVPEHVTIFLES